MSRAQQLPILDPLPVLSKTERNVLVQEAYESYEQLFTAVRIARGTSSGTALGGVSGATSQAVMMCTTTTVAGTLEEVAEVYTARDSHFILDFAQSTRIYELESPSPHHPMRCVGLRWSRWASISKFVTDRDLLYLETMDEFLDKKTGRRGWARCTKSIEHRACPPSQHPNGPIRAELFVMGTVLRETSTIGVLELITLVHADVKNSIPSWITRTVLKSRKKNALGLNHVLKVRRRIREGGGSGSGGSLIGDFTGRTGSSSEEGKDLPPRTCKGCLDHVSRWTRSYKCRKCHDMICKSCAAMTYFDTDTHATQNRICAECSFGVDEEDESVETASNDGHGVDSSSRRGQSTRSKKRGDEGSTRQRTFSYLSVDNESVGSVETTSTEEQEDLGATMKKLTLLNASQIKRVKEPISEQQQAEQASLHRLQGPTAGPPSLRRQHSSSSNSGRGTKQSQRRVIERAVSQDAAGFRDNQAPPSAPTSGSSTESNSSAAKTPRKVRSSPAYRAAAAPAQAPAAMVDLSYLQSFASSKPKKDVPPPEQPVGQLV